MSQRVKILLHTKVTRYLDFLSIDGSFVTQAGVPYKVRRHTRAGVILRGPPIAFHRSSHSLLFHQLFHVPTSFHPMPARCITRFVLQGCILPRPRSARSCWPAHTAPDL